MLKSKYLFIFLTSIVAGVLVALIATAFTGPGTLTPGSGNPDFWLKSGSDIYYNPTSGNVGIGTASPGSGLDVHGTVAFNPSNGSVDSHFFTSSDGAGVYSIKDGSGNIDIRFNAVTNDASYVNNGGNFGIGTSTPGTPLDVYGTLRTLSKAAVAPTAGTGLEIYYDTNADQAVIDSNARSPFSRKPLAIQGTPLKLYENATEVIRITGGNVGIGTTSSIDQKLKVYGGNVWVGPNLHTSNGGVLIDGGVLFGWGTGVPTPPTYTAYMWLENGDTYGYLMVKFASGLTPLSIRGSNGYIGIGVTVPGYQLQLSTDSAGKPNGGSWSDSSDIRLKKEISPITNALDKITQLQGVNFQWKNPDQHQAYGVRQGFIAQEVEKVFPNFITEIDASGKDKLLTENGKIKTLSLPFDFDAYLVEAIKEQQAEIKELKTIVCSDHPDQNFCK